MGLGRLADDRELTASPPRGRSFRRGRAGGVELEKSVPITPGKTKLELVLIVVGRTRLKTYQWILLGLCQLPVVVSGIIAGWLSLLAHRRTTRRSRTTPCSTSASS